MFDVKVKTLDGRNTSFTVDDEITVAEFKEKISEAVNIPASCQRLIFTGKVLSSDNKLKSYNVADKVIHVVNSRPPPQTGNSSAASNVTAAPSTSAAAGPTVSMSSVPSNMIGEMMSNVMAGLHPGDAAMVHHVDLRRSTAGPPQHTEAGRRVVLIRQWIRDAHSLLDRITNPSQGTRLSADSQTPEARNASQAIHPLVGSSVSVTTTSTAGPRPSTGGSRSTPTPTTSQASSARPAAAQTGNSASAAEGTIPNLPPVNPNIEVLKALWGEVDALSSRLHVHTHRFRDLLSNPSSGCPGHNQHLFDIMSSVTHSYGHIYHALSDLHCDFSPEASRELTASTAAAPPPTAIIQQTIPVTIPLRATVNVAPSTIRRGPANATTNTSSSTSDAARPSAQQATAGQHGGVYTSIELDMETDSGEDITEDGQRSGAAPAGSAGPAGPGGFNISQFIQQAFQGMAGMGGGVSAPPSTTTAAATSTATSAAGSNAAGVPPGSFGPFIPPPGAATPANGPVGQQFPSGLPPGFPFPHGANHTPKDRQDPYLSSCSSKYWLPPQDGSARTSNSRTNISRTAARPPSTANSRTASTTSQRSNTPSTTPRQGPVTRSRANNTTTGGSPVSRSGSNTSMDSISASTSLPSGRAAAPVDEERRQFLNNIRDSLVNMVIEQPWLTAGQSRVPVPSLQRLTSSLREAFNSAVLGRAHLATISELNRMTADVDNAADSAETPQLGLLGELCSLLFNELTLVDLYHAFVSHGRHFDRLRGPLRRFARSNVLQDGSPSEENLSAAVGRLIVSIRSQLQDTVREVTQDAVFSYDVVQSLCSYIKTWLMEMLSFLIGSKEGTENYGQQLLDRLHQGFRDLMRLSYSLLDSNSDLRESARLTQRVLVNVVEHCTRSNRALSAALQAFMQRQISTNRYVESIDNIALGSLEQHRIRAKASTRSSRQETSMNTSSIRGRSPSSGDSDYHDTIDQGDDLVGTRPPVDNSLRAGMPTQSSTTVSPSPLDTSSLSEASAVDWRTVIPADWVAIIEEDIKRQLRLQNSSEDQPLSDTYLSGRPQKRRRLSEDEEDQ